MTEGRPEASEEGTEGGAQAPAPLSIRKNMLWNSFGSLANLACQYLIGIVIVRLSDGFGAAGVYSLALSVYYVFSPVAEYRMNTIQVSDVRDEHSTGEYLAFRLLTCGAGLVLSTGYAMLTCADDAWASIFLFVLYRYVMVVLGVFHSCCQQNMRMDYIGISSLLQGVVSLGVFVVAFGLTRSLELTLSLMTLSMVAIGVAYTYPRARRFGPIRLGISWHDARTLLVSCAPIVIGGIMFNAAGSAPKQYLSTALGADALGAYASVSQPVAIIQMGASYVYLPLLGYFSRAHAEGRRSRFLRLLARTTAGLLLVFVACSVGLGLLGEPVLVLLCGEVIRPYTYLLQPLALYIACSASVSFLSDLAVALRHFGASFVGSAVQLAVTLALMGPVIDSLGMVGASVVGIAASCAAIVVIALLLLVRLRGSFGDEGERGDSAS